MNAFHLAQLNVGRLLVPLASAEMDEFRALLDEINAIADRTPGFVWRMLQADTDPTPFQRNPDDVMLVNMSVWSDMESLERYVYADEHLAVMKRRREWFHKLGDAHMALWWIPAGHVPTLAEAATRLAFLTAHGPTEDAFTFKAVFPTPDFDAEPLQRAAGST